VIATHWGTGLSGFVAVVLVVAGAPLAFPADGPAPWEPRTLAVFALVTFVGNRVVAGRNRALAALRASEAQLRATWEHTALGTARLNRAGEIEDVNPALERVLGYSRAECAGMSFSALDDDDPAAAKRRFADLIAGTEAFSQDERRYRRKDHALIWCRVTVSVIRTSDGTPNGALVVVEDISAERQAAVDLRTSEEKLRQAQKIEAVGRLVAGVAHNFNNLLTVTLGYTERLKARHPNDGQDQKDLDEIYKATRRGASLTRQLLAFGRKRDVALSRIDLNRALAGVEDMLRRVIREDIRLTIEAASDPAIVLIDKSDFDQVVLNLVLNARDALPKGGTISVAIARESIDATSRPAGSTVSGTYVRLRVRDNGTGMTPDVESHLFEPFFTTKEVGQGTGLGLAFVAEIARHASGFVRIDTAPDEGTTVSVYFQPALEGAGEPAPDMPAEAEDRKPRPATILLVEDEQDVRDLTALMLTSAGHDVFSAAAPAEARTLFDRHAATIDLLVTDVVMPEMHGPVLAERLRATRPDLPVLFLSGYSDAMPTSASSAFLAKPFSSSRLLATVDRLLGARAH
jgi:PAS domain S-box-containing protein